MSNYSDNGLYFESDVVFQKGTKIYVSIQNSPYPRSSGVLKYYKGQVMWRKDLKRSSFHYGYGIRLYSNSNNPILETDAEKNTEDARRHPRKPFFRTVQFYSQKGTFKGSTKNISASGVFIATEQKLEVGQVLKLDLPLKGKTVEIIGTVVWLDDEGFGLEFKKKE